MNRMTCCNCGASNPKTRTHCRTCNHSLEETNQAVSGLKYIAESPDEKYGGFHPQTIQIAKDALAEIAKLREALLLYHEAWNGSVGNWRDAMCRASENARVALGRGPVRRNAKLSGGPTKP